MTIHAVYENGVFRPTDKVAFPDHCEVEIEVRQVKEAPTISALDDVYAILGKHHASSEHDLAGPLNGDQSLSRRVRIVGILDVIRASNQTFVLQMPDESEVLCTLLEGNVESLATLLRNRVLILAMRLLTLPAGFCAWMWMNSDRLRMPTIFLPRFRSHSGCRAENTPRLR